MANDADSQESQKQLAFYSALVEAWIETRMEKDKTLLTLATAGIGFLTTLLTTVGPAGWYQLWLYGFAGAAFICTIVTAILVFDQNSRHLEDVILHNVKGDDKLLVRLDLVVFLSFVVGVILTAAIALSSGIAKIRLGGSP
jgi:hypothetical protein